MKFCVLSLSILLSALSLSACTSTPKGTPAETKAANAAANAVVILGGLDANPRFALGDQTADSTRMEILVTGLMSCASLSPRDTHFVLTDATTTQLAFGEFSSKWDAVTAALLKKEESYQLKLTSQRTGKVIFSKAFIFSGEAPWKLFLPVTCPAP